MKIVILGPAHPLRGGIAALNERLATQLISEGDDVTIYSFSLQYPSILFPGKTQKTTDPAPLGIKIVEKVNSVNPLNWITVGNELKRMRPDLILVRYWLPFMGPALGSICRLARSNGYTKVICIADNIIPHEKRIGDYSFTRYFTGGVDGYITMSHDVYKDIDCFVKNPIKRYTEHPIYDHYGEIIPRQEALERLKFDDKYRYILFFGFIRDYKGLDLLLNAMADERLRALPLKLLVAGEYYGNKEKYEALIKTLDIENNVLIRSDYIPNNEINLYFCASDLIVQPYKSATQSGVAQIGYHFNKAMLVTRVGGLHEIIEDKQSGYVVEPAVKEIADAIVDFYVNERQSDYEQRCKMLKGRFAWDIMTQNIKKLYQEIKGS
ncbi:MAG: glycosyltransferase [Marinifilaceae bacterium]